ncbi:DUF4329 domain-containing protein [Pontixanthobacter aestiaquae]|uniref:DUF4329 domain-containing protein n=1 Tax=Pontixanthobacter aestiaquae TaxID=1509367 RepID=A0A844Z6C4_9SPHN|nr:DUF4329 domain-containing protein [Pontixanthobacter aestiaquae]MDN3645537.1 DUF4329 domain-containing protein [Pontixanthobacter aestiaquae]MXO83465.1 DUF4329 domain-containing protein [Pontixanthobacter aestiaquae]
MAILFALWLVIVLRAAMNTKGPEAFVTTVPQSQVEDFAREQLASLQRRSFSDDQELCAVIFEDSDGKLGTTRLVAGEQASCDIAYFDEPGMAPVASFHTHGAFSREYDSEVPSLLDMRSDIAARMDGYVSTPGGRFWRIDAQAGMAKLVCGEGCLPQDPSYVPCKADVIASSYSIEQLANREQEGSAFC